MKLYIFTPFLVLENGRSHGVSIIDNNSENNDEKTELPVYRVSPPNINEDPYDDNEFYDYDDDDGGVKFIGPPYFITVHQLVEVMEYDTAVLECAITNIDTSVTVSSEIVLL